MNMATITGDKDFLQKMVAHHKMALSMCHEIYTLTKRQQIKDFAETMYNTQKHEIATMEAWIKQL